jgi:hypothetical protein
MCPEKSAQQSLLNLLYQLVQTHFFPDFLLHVTKFLRLWRVQRDIDFC